jgi:Ca-activated chloride channel family protein
MAGSLENDRKIDLARNVINDLARSAPRSLRMGVVVYGSTYERQANRCDDLRVAQPLSPVNSLAIGQALAAVNPKGMSPIGAALRLAADQLKGASAPTIVLVSDGVETCGENVCEVARDLTRRTGVEIRVNVIGLEIKETERQLLECAAKETGGQYFPVAQAAQMRTALNQVTAAPRGGAGPMWASIGHPGIGEMINSRKGFRLGMPKRKFFLGFIPFFGWPGYLQVVSAIDAYRGKTHDWPDPGNAGQTAEPSR